MDILHALLLPYLTRAASLWPEPEPPPEDDEPSPPLMP